MPRSTRALPLVLVTALAALVGAVVTGPAAVASSPGWLNKCGYSHSAMNDPIVFPRQPGASHLHDFLGNKSTNARSTLRSMRAAGTTCTLKTDTAGYWAPALYRNGTRVLPRGSWAGRATRQQIYYRDDNVAPGTHIHTIPADLRLVAGQSHAMSAAENPELGKEIYWGCSDNSTGKRGAPPASCSSGIISLHIGFPNCWDGVRTHRNDTVHVVYPHSYRCPAKYPTALPRVILRLEYPVGPTTGTITLGSGATYTVHGDFWNTWQQTRLNRLVADCLNTDKDCGTPTR
jgi:hypothetical protein